MRRLATLGALTLGVIWTVLVAGPTFGQSPDGTVTATVNVNIGPCITVAPASFTYAPARFSASQLVTTTPSGTKPIVTNCSNQAENIMAHGSAATGTGANWTLVGGLLNCTQGPNRYKHELAQTGGGTFTLTTTSQTWEPGVLATAGLNTRVLDGTLTMPCTGSSGAGQTMTMTIFLTAVIP